MNEIDPGAGSLLGIPQRMPPSNLAAEQGAALRAAGQQQAYERVSEFLAPEHFADAVHGRIFQAIQRRVEAGQLADVVTLRAEFEHSGLLDEVGGAGYLAQLLAAMVRHHQRRRILAASSTTPGRAASSSTSARRW